MDFYSARVLPEYFTPEAVREAAAEQGPLWIATDNGGLARLDSAGVSYAVTAAFKHIAVSRLTGRFLNPRTREQALIPVFLLKIPAEK